MPHNKQFEDGFTPGMVDEDGFTTHEARRTGSVVDGVKRSESIGLLNRNSTRRSSVATMSASQRASFSRTSSMAADRAFILPAGGIGASVFNLCSATLGAGVLALPLCMAYSGSLISACYVVCTGTASAYAIIVLVMVSDRTGYMSYEEMSLELLGPKWVYVSVGLIGLLCFGTAVGYIIAIGDIIDPLRALEGAPSWMQGQTGRYLSQVAWWSVFFLPASLPKSVNSLRYASCIGVGAIAFLIVTMLVHLLENKEKPTTKLMEGGTNSLFSLPVIMFGYGCQVNTFGIYSEMHKRHAKRMGIVAIIALFLCSSFYIIAGMIGYSDFGAKVSGNVLKDYDPTTNWMAAVAYVGVSVTVTMAFPLCVFPTRDAIAFVLFGDPEDNPMTNNQRQGLVVAISVLILLSGMFIPKITMVFGVVGGLCIGAIGYSIPAAFAIKCEGWTRESVGLPNIIATYVLFVFGIITSSVGTAISLYHIATSA